MKNAVEIRGLRKSYGAHEVLKGLDFRVRQGEIFALCQSRSGLWKR